MESGERALLPAIRKQLGHLHHIGKLIPNSCRINLANVLILSRMSYLMPLWGGAPEKYLSKAQTVMNATARWATGLPRRTRISTLLEVTGWLSVREQARVATAVQVWKLVHYGKPQRLQERMTVLDDLTIQVQDPRLMFSHNHFRWRATREWNNRPTVMK